MTYLPLPTAYLWRRPDGTTITIDPAEIQVVYAGEDPSKGEMIDRAFAMGTLGMKGRTAMPDDHDRRRTAATAAMDQHLAASHTTADRGDRVGTARELISALDAAMATLPPCCPCTEEPPRVPDGDCDCECHYIRDRANRTWVRP